MRAFLVAAIGLVGVSVVLPCAARGEDPDRAFRDALTAFNEGAYGRAAALWEPLAEAGDARAQTSLGFMYYSGRGVARDSAHAAALFAGAAERGEPTAQLFLALMNFYSDGMPRNAPLALMWLELALAGGQPGAFGLRDALMQSTTAAEQEEGSRLVARWRADHPGQVPRN